MISEVRTRFAPSPTGYMHIGNLRTALYSYLFARSRNGKFILRIEDTDSERYIEDSMSMIFNTLKETKLFYDEGPDIGGKFGPYIQSQRKEIYFSHAKKLVNQGDAYYCFCDKERLRRVHDEQKKIKVPPKYDGYCRNISNEEIQRKLELGISYVIRQKIPKFGFTSFEDEVFGNISVENFSLDDGVLIKSDGLPTYNFANVIDDHLMKISHVIRGNEYLSSTPKYVLLYKSFDWKIPYYVHVPPIIKENGKKLSKRDGDATFEDLIKLGFLEEAIINFIALLGWSSKTEREIFSLSELEEMFDITGLGKSPAVFDVKKLLWLNGEYIKKMTFDEFHKNALVYYSKVIKNSMLDLEKVSELLHTRCEKFSDIVSQVDFFEELKDYEVSLFIHKKMKTDFENSLSSLIKILQIVEELPKWNEEILKDKLVDLAVKLNVKNGVILWPLRVAVTGKAFTPGGGVEISIILGKEETIKRIKIGIEKLKNLNHFLI
ncbi:MAG: glutamate--tRNA ligase [Clostridiales bacterium]|jgi:glutamyl-tRNA synthetase|nr:glutamate--tRNA ligase [Clostridiales bacterium]